MQIDLDALERDVELSIEYGIGVPVESLRRLRAAFDRLRELEASLERVNAAARDQHAALQRIGSALDLLPGSDLHRDCMPAIKAMREDAARLEWMASREAWIAWSRDGELCRVFHRDEDGDAVPIMGWNSPWHESARAAIDAARGGKEHG